MILSTDRTVCSQGGWGTSRKGSLNVIHAPSDCVLMSEPNPPGTITVLDVLAATTIAGLVCPAGIVLGILAASRGHSARAALFLVPSFVMPATILVTVMVNVPQARAEGYASGKQAGRSEEKLNRTMRMSDRCPRECW